MEIGLIDKESQGMIEATLKFPILANVVFELVKNAVRAKADFIEVEIRDGRIWVKDNGEGMGMDELSCVWGNEDSSVGLLMKIANVTVYSFKTQCFSVKNKRIAKSRALEKQGTVVIVENLFFNVPGRAGELSKEKLIEGIRMAEAVLVTDPMVFASFLFNGEVLARYERVESVCERLRQVTGCQKLRAVRFYGKFLSVEGYVSELGDCVNHKNYQFLFSEMKTVVQPDVSNRINSVYADAQRFLCKDSKVKKFPVFLLNLCSSGVHCVENWYFDGLCDLTVMLKEQVFNESTAVKIFDKYLKPTNLKREKCEWIENKSFSFSSEVDDEKLVESFEDFTELTATKKKNLKLKPNFSYKNFASPKVNQVLKEILPKSLQNFSYDSIPTFALYKNTKVSFGELVVNNLVIDKVIGQVDSKFIAAVINAEGSQFLTVFDQHASHERIRLEQLLSGLEKGLSEEKCKILVKLTGEDLKKMSLKEKHLQKFKFVVRKEGEFWYLIKLPVVFGTVLTLSDFLEALHGEGEIPEPVMNVLKYKACRSAVKFGDCLSLQESCKMLIELAQCRAFNQCAHGRPTFYPLFKIPAAVPLKKPVFYF